MRILMALLTLPALTALDGCVLEEEDGVEVGETDESVLAEVADLHALEIAGEARRAAAREGDGEYAKFSQSPFFGGGGGILHQTPHAPLAGFQLRTGTVLDQITLIYFDGTALTFGGGGGVLRPAQFCAAADLPVGIHGAAGTLVDRLGLICETPAGSLYATAAQGGPGGTPFAYVCPIFPEQLYGLDVRTGTLVDAVHARCD